MDTIQRAIKRGTGELVGVTYEAVSYEGYAPCGVAVYVEVLTDNKNRTAPEIRVLFRAAQLGAAGTRIFKSHSGSHFILRAWASNAGSSGKNSSGVFSSVGVRSSTENLRLKRRMDQ